MSVINMLSAVIAASSARLSVYMNDGSQDNQSLLGSSIALTSGDTITLKFIAPSGGYDSDTRTFFINDGGTLLRARILGASGDVIDLDGCTAIMDGSITLTSGATAMPTDGLEHEIVFTITVTGNVAAFSGQISGGQVANFPIYEIEVDDGATTLDWPCHDGVNPMIEGSAGTNNLTIQAGYNASLWG